ncbi:MAG: hypothetical protein M1522_09575 [Actinobacteria bacterium]|jgi:hypothetical protein|nr:hypothetical protein [Actinomycetota bacterium]MDA8183350.1 hypothetical protein [Actinomycetota bacterium]
MIAKIGGAVTAKGLGWLVTRARREGGWRRIDPRTHLTPVEPVSARALVIRR